MELRPYCPTDCTVIAELFYQTVHTVNARDYTPQQLDAWASGQVDLEKWKESFLAHDTWVAVEKGILTGFADMDQSGYLDRLYVHKDFQDCGIATLLCNKLEQRCAAHRFTTHASITARPFFEKRGYQVVKEQQVERGGILLTNFVMVKENPLSGNAPAV